MFRLEFRKALMILLVLVIHLLGISVSFGSTSCGFQTDIDRVAGSDRYSTASTLATNCFVAADTAVIATGENFADALSGAPLAAAVDGPILLTNKNGFPTSTSSALRSLGTNKVILLGGTAAVSSTVEKTIRGMGITVERIAGSDRYDTSAKIALRLDDETGGVNEATAIIATGENFPDALSASSLASEELFPILLVRMNDVPDVIEDALNDLNISKLLVVGGTGVIASSTTRDLDLADGRIAGADRYQTSYEIRSTSISEHGMASNVVYVASGTNFPDALVAGPVAAFEENAPIILVNPNTPADPSVRDFFRGACDELDHLVIIGGEKAISASMEDFLTGALECDLDSDGDQDEDAGDGVADDGGDGSRNINDDGDYDNDGDKELTTKMSVYKTGTDYEVDIKVHVIDEDYNYVEDANVTLQMYLKPDGESDYGSNICSDIMSASECTDSTNSKGDVLFNDVLLDDFNIGDEIKIVAEASKSTYENDSDSIPVVIEAEDE